VAKRRNRGPSADGTPDAPVSAEERRRARKRERTAREAGNVRPRSRGSGWKRAVLFGVPVAVVAVIIVILIINPFKPPCTAFAAIPSSSGSYPEFPLANQSLDASWCPPNPSYVLQAYPLLRISIEGNGVGLPTGIGVNRSYTLNGQPYTCILPIAVLSASEGGSLPGGTIYINSPWPYIYNLSSFFHVWAQTSSTVNVNSSHPSQPVQYTATDLLGFTADASHAITLWVDNTPSTAGPGLNLDTLTNQGSPYPSCIGSIYGTGHTVLLSYTSTAAHAAARPAPPGATAGHEIGPLGPAPAISPVLWASLDGRALFELKGLGWLALRSPGP
jgi:hypothetical protein